MTLQQERTRILLECYLDPNASRALHNFQIFHRHQRHTFLLGDVGASQLHAKAVEGRGEFILPSPLLSLLQRIPTVYPQDSVSRGHMYTEV
jgi:hypothetical protein